MKVKKDSEKAELKLKTQKPKITAFGPVTSMQIDREKVEAVTESACDAGDSGSVWVRKIAWKGAW